MNSIITVEVSLNKKINFCSGIDVINKESLKFVQDLIVPNYLESLDFDINKFELTSNVIMIEVDKQLDSPSEISPEKLLWKFDEKSSKKYTSEYFFPPRN